MPEVLPSPADLKAGLEILTAQTARVDRRHAAYCLAKMVTANQVKWSDVETEQQLAVWLEANGDLPNDLWSQATMFLMQHHKFGMPKPVHMRHVVETQLKGRLTKLQRIQQMVVEDRKRAAPQREPREVRVRTMRNTFRRIGQIDRAAKYEIELAEIEQREPEEWAVHPAAPAAAAGRDDLPVIATSPEMQRRLLPGIIRARAGLMGANHPSVAKLKAELARLNGEPVVDDAEMEPEVI